MSKDLLLHPVKTEDFFSQYWESQPLHVSRANAGHFASLLSTESILRYVKDNEIRFPDIQVVDANRSLSSNSYTRERIIQSDLLLDHHNKGATIILSEVHKKFAAITDLCWQVSQSLQFASQANAYLSPAGNQGFHAHYDTHDVFVLQVSGRKTFRFYPSDIELPFPDDTYHPDNNPGGDAVEEVELSAGDTLYIPRGIVHDAQAHEGEPSLHITLGVFPFIVRDLLQEMVQVAAEKDAGYRAFIDLRSDHALADKELRGLIDGLLSPENYREALSRMSDSLAVMNTARPAASLAPAVNAGSVLQIDESSILSFEKIDDHFKLRVAGQVLRFYAPYCAAVEQLLDEKTLPLAELSGLDADQKLALCERLLNVGAVKVVSANS